MIGLVFEFILSVLIEFWCYYSGAIFIRLMTLGRVRFPLWGLEVFQDNKHSIEHIGLCRVVGFIVNVVLIFIFIVWLR